MPAALNVLIGLAGVALVAITGLDVVGTLVITEGVSQAWRPARIFYHWSWRLWRGIGARIKTERQRERWIAVYGPLSMLSLLLMWLLCTAVGWALIYMAVLGELHGASDFPTLLYYSAASLFTPEFGDVSRRTAAAGLLSLAETAMGFGTIALLISYLPVLYGAYNRREARLLTLDDPSGERITPGAVITVHTPDGELEPLYRFFAEWELWTAEILESHVSYPMLAYFRSQHPGQSWITALGVVMDAATLTCAVIPDAGRREPYFMYRRGRRALTEITRRLHAPPGAESELSRDLFAIAYQRLKEANLPVDPDFDAAVARLQATRPLYGHELQGLIDYLL
ncbi:MAG TPA: hypothetical protein VFS62_17410, partial [Chloroflexota bacterium]|nr:hypothetical protein [Chloroflexota bacterium]